VVEHGPAPTDGRASYAVATACPTQTATEHSSEARRFQIMRRQGVHFSTPLHTQCGTDKHFEWSRRSGLIVSGKFSKSRGGGWSWYAGDFAVTGSFGEDAHHDQEAG